MHRVLVVTLLAVVLLVITLVTANLTGNPAVLVLGGMIGLIAGGLALYMGLGLVINEIYEEKILPV